MPQTVTGITRKTLRQTLGFELGDIVLIKATSAGGTTTFTDANHIHPASYKGRFILFTSGTNNGEIRRITGGTPPSIDWGVAVPASTAVNDEAELWNMNGVGWRPDVVNEHIRMAHRRALESDMLFYLDDTSVVWDSTQGWADIPQEFRGISDIQFADGTGSWFSIPRSPRPSGPGYWINRYQRRIEINGDFRTRVNGRTFRILGTAREDELTQDTHRTLVNAEWLVAEAGRTLLMGNLSSDADTRFTQQKLAEFSRAVEMKRGMVVGRRAPNIDYVD